jgi:hypothetical protein
LLAYNKVRGLSSELPNQNCMHEPEHDPTPNDTSGLTVGRPNMTLIERGILVDVPSFLSLALIAIS